MVVRMQRQDMTDNELMLIITYSGKNIRTSIIVST